MSYMSQLAVLAAEVGMQDASLDEIVAVARDVALLDPPWSDAAEWAAAVLDIAGL